MSEPFPPGTDLRTPGEYVIPNWMMILRGEDFLGWGIAAFEPGLEVADHLVVTKVDRDRGIVTLEEKAPAPALEHKLCACSDCGAPTGSAAPRCVYCDHRYKNPE